MARNLSRTGTFRAHQAPGFLRTLQAFVNTRDLENGTDRLDSPESLALWLADWELATLDTVIEEAEWKNALEIRDALHSQFRVHNGAKLDERPMERLSRALGTSQARFGLKSDGSTRFEPMETAPWAIVRSRWLIAVTDAIRRGMWRRLKACHSATCQWIFYDSSKNRLGKWCTAKRCGNWANSATYRRRKPVYKRG